MAALSLFRIGSTKVKYSSYESGGSSLHLRTQPSEFKRLIDILQSPGVKMPSNQYHRKGQIDERMKKRTLDETCLIIRDLNTRVEQ